MSRFELGLWIAVVVLAVVAMISVSYALAVTP